jgi:hypothetical protein
VDDALVTAWTNACERLAAVGNRDDLDSVARTRWIEHAADQAVAWLSWEVLHADPSRPFFHRQNDLITQWGGPNADNVYRHARIEPGRRYRIRGHMHSCQEFLLAIRSGFMHRPKWGTLEQFTATEHGFRAGEDFDVILGSDGPDAVPIPDEAIMVSIREYYFDWISAEPATFTIECLDPDPEVDQPGLENRLEEALNEVEESIDYWDKYLANNRAKRTDNSFALDTVTVAKGLSNARYEFCFWDLEPDQALLVEWAEPKARYWSAQLYELDTFELIDPWGRISSRNQTQTVVSDDGRVRWIVAHEDPGHANWLDTAGRRSGLCTVRWFWPTGDSSATPTTRVVEIDDLVDELPEEQSWVDPEGRDIELAGRQAHLRWRFRT